MAEIRTVLHIRRANASVLLGLALGQSFLLGCHLSIKKDSVSLLAHLAVFPLAKYISVFLRKEKLKYEEV